MFEKSERQTKGETNRKKGGQKYRLTDRKLDKKTESRQKIGQKDKKTDRNMDGKMKVF